MKNYKTLYKALISLVVIVLILVLLFRGFQKLESSVLLNRNNIEAEASTAKTIVVDGISYFPRQDITVLMVLGIDRYGEVKSSNYHRNEGSADLVALLVFDDDGDRCNVLYINRDTMLDINMLSVSGNYAGTTHGQLALAHTYGSGLKDSCENTRETVSNFLNGVYIDHYVSVNMEAISIINDAVGGVKVNVKEDFSEIDPSIQQGEVILNGEQAVNYVRTRKNVGDQLNLTRMERHREYVYGFMEALDAKREDDSFSMDLLEQLLPYMVTDTSLNTLNSMFTRYEEYELGEIITLSGENMVEDGHYAFYVDEDHLQEVVLDLFYVPLS